MAIDDPILTISVAASLLGLHPRTLMLYEKAGFLAPHRTNTNRRMFSLKDLDDLQFIKYLTHQKGINLQGVKTILNAIYFTQSQGVNLRKELFADFAPKKLV